MSGELQRQRVLNFLDAFYGGDTEAALKCCDDDIESMVYLPVELFPHLGPRRGKAAISELMDVHEARYASRRFEVKFLVVDEQRAAGIIDMIAQLTGRDLVGPLLRETGPALRPPEMPADASAAKTLSKKYT